MWPSFHLFPLTILEKSHQEIFRHWQHNHLSWNRQAGWLALYPQQQELELLLCYCGEGGVLPLLRFKASRPLMGLLASEQPQEVAQIQIDESSPQLSRDWGLDLALLLDLSPASCTPSNCPQSCTLPAPDSGMPLFLLLFPSPFRSLCWPSSATTEVSSQIPWRLDSLPCESPTCFQEDTNILYGFPGLAQGTQRFRILLSGIYLPIFTEPYKLQELSRW